MDWKTHKKFCVKKEQDCSFPWKDYKLPRIPTTFSNQLRAYASEKYPQIELMESVQGFEYLGRCLVASKDFCKGESILQEFPLFSFSNCETEASCFNCYLSCRKKRSKRCDKCGCIFCSDECYESCEKHEVCFNHV